MNPSAEQEKELAFLSSDKALTVDDVLQRIGSFGRYQFGLLLIMGFMKIFGQAFQMMIPSFLAAEPPWTCAVNSTVCNITGTILPGHAHYNLRCNISRHDWEFDTSQFNSIVSEWDLVCDKSSLSGAAKSVVFGGFLIGVMFGGVISDKFGRKPVVYYPSVLCNILALAASFVHVFWLFALLRGLIGICAGSSSMALFVLLVEYVGVQHRAKAASTLWYFWVLSLMLLAFWGYLIRDWRYLSIAGAVPGLLQVFFWWGLPESARWLLINKRHKEAVHYLSIVAKRNHKEMPEGAIGIIETKQRVGDIRDLFRSRKVVHRTVVCMICWIVVTMVYYGVSFSAGDFGGNRYLVFFLVSIVELPSNWSAYNLMDRFGRKKTVILGYIAAAVFSTCAVLLQRDLSDKGFLAGRIIMSMTAKFFINIAFAGIFVYTAELFPTVARNVAMGACSGVGRAGAIAAPFIIWLVRVHVLLPYSIMAVCACVAAILCFTLPETQGTQIPEVFDKGGLPAKEINQNTLEKLNGNSA